MKKFLTKENVKVLWKLFNEACGLVIGVMLFLKTNDVAWAGGGYILVSRLSEMSTRWFNKVFLQSSDDTTGEEK